MSSFQAAGDHRLLGRASMFIEESRHVWSREFRSLASRAMDLVQNDPFAAAMVGAKLFGTHGASGLHFRSLYQIDDRPETSEGERQVRREIEASIGRASSGTRLDITGLMSRKEFEQSLDWTATVKGDAWAFRRLIPGRRGSHWTTWRMTQPERVSNPDGRPNDDSLYEGMEIGPDGDVVAVHVETGTTGPFGYTRDKQWVRIPWVADDGTPNVIHRCGWRLPGMLRGVTMFAPMLLLMKQVSGTVEAHVAGKRAQACHPIIEKTQDEEALAEAERVGARLGPYTSFAPLQVLLTSLESEVVFPQHSFQGDDLKDFLQINYRLLAAAWGLPVEVVLAQMGEASLASARAGLDHFNRRCHELQNEHIVQVTRHIDESIIREDAVRGRLSFQTDDWSRIMTGRYQRPPKFVTDSQKEAGAVKTEVEIGRSRRNAFGDRGWDWEAETEERAQEDRLLAAQGQPVGSGEGRGAGVSEGGEG